MKHTPPQDYLDGYHALYGRPHPQDTRTPKTAFNRHLLPDPTAYYAEHLSLNTHGRSGWVPALCPLHDEKSPSLSVNLDHGGYRCHGCGEKGGDILSFHMRRHGLDFKTAAKELGAWE